ncbi:hypothetical protein [Methylobacterium persicinum]|uniref:Uncharacterized protein involved in copper resistance n=1 Tax=Methylobacterium persicinum TaxID=374426 RepID=A0ABU0HR07_9HYPH|nr:hypothetical protein [Methylobacterium persicinum]MDQ0444145.1 uncharacterized protein involved in copper resistance [Methylobacterium persicinum]GJE40781.1 hypothetical protein KHHGKMAE_4878 [Methylobacterium persicinum]
MKKTLFAAAILATLGAASVAPASAAPGMIGAVDAPTTLTEVRMDDMRGHRGHMMGHRHMRGHMMRHHRGHHMMGHHHMRGHMMGHHRGHRM